MYMIAINRVDLAVTDDLWPDPLYLIAADWLSIEIFDGASFFRNSSSIIFWQGFSMHMCNPTETLITKPKNNAWCAIRKNIDSVG